jgi:AraC family transcriptional regulator
MNLQPRIQTLQEKKLIGKKLTMTFAENKTAELWKSFMPRRNEIQNKISDDLISMQIFPKGFTMGPNSFNTPFVKWAAIEVKYFSNIPEGMETFILSEGMYAVFDYKGLSTDTKIFEYIFGTWFPKSGYDLDNRPQFEILGEKYKNNDPDSEEEIWIPIQMKI